MPGQVGQITERVIFIDREIGIQPLADQRGDIHAVVISAHGRVHLGGTECVGPDAQVVDESAERGADAAVHFSDGEGRGIGHVKNGVAPLRGPGLDAVDVQGQLLSLSRQSHMRPLKGFEQIGRQKTRTRDRVGAGTDGGLQRTCRAA